MLYLMLLFILLKKEFCASFVYILAVYVHSNNKMKTVIKPFCIFILKK